jgi:hypothetical protein
MSLIGTIRNAIDGREPWSNVLEKAESLVVDDVVDPVESFSLQFASDFGKAALLEAGTYGPQIAADLVSGNASQIPALIPVIAQKLASDGITVAETDAAKDVNQIIGNALRVQGTAVLLNPPASSPVSTEAAAATESDGA